jgi:hypothetical protein
MCLDMVFSPGFFFYMAEKSVFQCAPTSFCPIGSPPARLEWARRADSSREIPVPIGPAVSFLCCCILSPSLVLVGCAFGGVVGRSLMVGRGGARWGSLLPDLVGFPQPTIFRALACATTRRRTGARRPAFESPRRALQNALFTLKFRSVFASACRCCAWQPKVLVGWGGEDMGPGIWAPAKAR